MKKQAYISPQSEVLELKHRGILCSSQPTEENQGVTWSGNYE